jgi:glutathione synthase/RimK-type ligase-like ATP-grasp enzyme
MRIAILKASRDLLQLAGEKEGRTSGSATLLSHLREREDDACVIESWSDVFTIPDVHLTRFFAAKPELSAIAAYFESRGSRPLNSLQSNTLMNNKHASHLAFAEYGLRQLPWQVTSLNQVIGFSSWQGATIKKPVEGFAGDDIEVFPTRREALASQESHVILQPFLADAKSWRIVVGERMGIISSYYRLPKDGEAVAAVSLGSERIYDDPGREAKRMAEAMRRSVGGTLVGCDLLEKDGVFFALEINNSIGLDPDNEELLEGVREEITSLQS